MPPGAYQRQASQMLIESLNDHHLVQLQRETTREKSILDLYITNRPGLVKSINTVPNISDHEGAIVVDSAITPTKLTLALPGYSRVLKIWRRSSLANGRMCTSGVAYSYSLTSTATRYRVEIPYCNATTNYCVRVRAKSTFY